MDGRILIWLPGGKIHPQHSRLKTILMPLCEELKGRGWPTELRSVLDHDFTSDPDCVNIWLATELGEFPPRGGANILWFLSQMKIMTQPVLMGHDAFLTSSHPHKVFLQNWLASERHVGVAGWPVTHVPDHEPGDAVKPVLELEPLEDGRAGTTARIMDLPASMTELHRFFSRFRRIVSNVPLREKMCGFYRYEEIVALMAGCQVVSETRRGLLPELDAMRKTSDDASFVMDPCKDTLKQLADELSPRSIASAIIDAIPAAQSCAANRNNDLSSAKTGFSKQSIAGSDTEWSALCRDAHYVLNHRIAQDIKTQTTSLEKADLYIPWAATERLDLEQFDVPLPWTDLSLTRALCDAAADDALILTTQDKARIGAIVETLSCLRAEAFSPPKDENLPTVPWNGVATASSDTKRIFNDLSRALNSHNLYRFSQSVDKPKALCDPISPQKAMLSDIDGKIAIFLHAFYVDTAKSILRSLPELLHAYPLYVTTNCPEKAKDLERFLEEMKWPRFEIRQVANKGRDIFPKLVALSTVHTEYQYVLHLHTKKSPHSKSLEGWGDEAVTCLAGTTETIEQTLAAFAQDERLGIVYPDPPTMLYPAISWVRNLRISEMLSCYMDLPKLPESADLDFPVGSMFWVRTAAIEQLLNANLAAAFFPQEAAQEDGTLAHAIERMLGATCQINGWKLARATGQ